MDTSERDTLRAIVSHLRSARRTATDTTTIHALDSAEKIAKERIRYLEELRQRSSTPPPSSTSATSRYGRSNSSSTTGGGRTSKNTNINNNNNIYHRKAFPERRRRDFEDPSTNTTSSTTVVLVPPPPRPREGPPPTPIRSTSPAELYVANRHRSPRLLLSPPRIPVEQGHSHHNTLRGDTLVVSPPRTIKGNKQQQQHVMSPLLTPKHQSTTNAIVVERKI
eukprot:PhF_6_TR37725/c0_g1_i2/m.56162